MNYPKVDTTAVLCGLLPLAMMGPLWALALCEALAAITMAVAVGDHLAGARDD